MQEIIIVSILEANQMSAKVINNHSKNGHLIRKAESVSFCLKMLRMNFRDRFFWGNYKTTSLGSKTDDSILFCAKEARECVKETWTSCLFMP